MQKSKEVQLCDEAVEKLIECDREMLSFTSWFLFSAVILILSSGLIYVLTM